MRIPEAAKDNVPLLDVYNIPGPVFKRDARRLRDCTGESRKLRVQTCVSTTSRGLH